MIEENEISPSQINLEITESTMTDQSRAFVGRIQALRQAGFTMIMDDFGTGFSQLSHMTDLPISALKIDRSFVQEVAGNRHQQAVCMMIIDMAQRLDLLVIAEGAEGQDQVDFLASVSCQQVQGYYFSPAVPLTQIPRYIEEQAFKLANYH